MMIIVISLRNHYRIWNIDNLLLILSNQQNEKTLKRAIFEFAHPGKQALFIFDQSSVHASLAPDALKASVLFTFWSNNEYRICKAFEMNKSDGGKQRKQKNTVIPMTNPDARFCGKPREWSVFSRKEDFLISTSFEPNAPQSVQSRAKIVVWHDSSASRMTSKTSRWCSRLW